MSKKTPIQKYLSQIGAKGGAASGESKRRGGSDYYAEISRKRWEKRRAEASPEQPPRQK